MGQESIYLRRDLLKLKETDLIPQEGPQDRFSSCSADIAIYGGQAGGGKTWALLMEPLHHVSTVPGYGAVIFRRTYKQVTMEGGMWDESMNIYPFQDPPGDPKRGD